MPLYEYQCEACGHRFERIVKFSDPPVDTCPVCSGKVHKQISSPAFQFKGTGWYITDYAKKSGGSESGEEKDKDKGKDSKTESKDAAPKEGTTTPDSGSTSSDAKPAAPPAPAAKD